MKLSITTQRHLKSNGFVQLARAGNFIRHKWINQADNWLTDHFTTSFRCLTASSNTLPDRGFYLAISKIATKVNNNRYNIFSQAMIWNDFINGMIF